MRSMVVLAGLLGLLCVSVPARAAPPAVPGADGSGPPTVTAEDVVFQPRTLRYGSPERAGLVPEHLAAMRSDAERFLRTDPPMYAGAVVLAARNGVIATHEAVGDAVRYASYDAGTGEATELPRDERVRMRRETVFDLASVSKLFTALAAVQLIERGRIGLEAPVARYLPQFAQNGKDEVTIRELLTHTSGLPAWDALYSKYDTPAERIAAVYAIGLEDPPGTAYTYSDLGLMALGKVIEEVSGRPLDAYVAKNITGPLGMTDTGFNPPRSQQHRIAATEYQPWTGRGVIRGSVHDENAWSLDGVAGHAGVFSTAHDLAVLAQTMLNGGRYGNARILRPDSVRRLLTNFNEDFPGDEHGLGFELSQRWYMDAMSSPVTAGHTGYTGTSLVIDPLSHSFVILLTNRVHPTREWGSNNPSRRAVARHLARATPVRPAEGRDAWFCGLGDERTATLGLPLRGASGGGRMVFDLWYDTEAGYDIGTLQASTDGGSSWQPVPMTLRTGPYRWSTDGSFSGFAARRWTAAAADLPAGTTAVRWRYVTDRLYQGRGIYVDGVRAWDADGRLIFAGHRPRDARLFQPDGWTRVRN